jgi:hypothetical protein
VRCVCGVARSRFHMIIWQSSLSATHIAKKKEKEKEKDKKAYV